MCDAVVHIAMVSTMSVRLPIHELCCAVVDQPRLLSAMLALLACVHRSCDLAVLQRATAGPRLAVFVVQTRLEAPSLPAQASIPAA